MNRGLLERPGKIKPGERRLISRVELGVNVTAAKVEFAIPPVGVGFEIVGFGSCDQATIQYLFMRFNDDSGSNYSWEGGEANSVPQFIRSANTTTASVVGIVTPTAVPTRVSAPMHVRVHDHLNPAGCGIQAAGGGLVPGVVGYSVWNTALWVGTGPVRTVHLYSNAGNIMGYARFDCFLNG